MPSFAVYLEGLVTFSGISQFSNLAFYITDKPLLVS